MKKVAIFVILAIFIIQMCSCSNKTYNSETIWAMDTAITIKIDANSNNIDELFDNCDSILNSLDMNMSRTNEGSDVYKINSTSSSVNVPDDTAAVIRTALDVSDITDGCFDITVLPYVLMWEDCGNKNLLPDAEYIQSIKGNIGYKNISIDGNTVSKLCADTQLDLGGIGKGYAADRVIEYLFSAGVKYGLISFGSNVAVFGDKPDGSEFKIGIKNPADTNTVVGYVYMSSGVLSVSGDYERYVEINGVKYHHIIDPSTGYPVSNGLHSVAVICDSGVIADALSTALFVMGKNAALELYNSGKIKFEAIFIGDDGITVTDGLTENFEYTAS